MGKPSRSIAIAVAIALFASSCSFFAVHAPASGAGSDAPCTDSDVVPAIDSGAGVVAIGTAAGEILVQNVEHPAPINSTFYAVSVPLLFVVGVVYLYAASRGTHKVEQCRATKQDETTGCDGCPERVP